MIKHTLRILALLAIGSSTSTWADEGGHAELDAFLEEAAALLPASSYSAPGGRANAQIETPADKATYGEWGPLLPWPFIPVTAANLPDGRIVTFASNQRTSEAPLMSVATPLTL